MSFLDAIILGAVQGLTEFLPVSSSGHLVLTEALLGVKQPGLTFELLVHFGTLLAVVFYFRTRLWSLTISLFDREKRSERAMIGFLILGTVPAGLVGVFFENFFEQMFDSPLITSFSLIATGLILLSTRWSQKGKGKINLIAAIVMGVGQAIAIFPGISRSGSTISAGMFAGVEPSKAAEFSFLLAIPVILGAIVLKWRELFNIEPSQAGQYAVGVITALLFGLAAVSLLLRLVKRGRFSVFGYYCFAAGAVGIYLFH